MKLSRFLVGTLACTLFAACSNEENSAINSGQEEGQLSYVAVNIVNANPTGMKTAKVLKMPLPKHVFIYSTHLGILTLSQLMKLQALWQQPITLILLL